MDGESWAALFGAAIGVVATAVVAGVTLRLQARLHREQLAAARETFDREQSFTERRIQDAVEREHFARLWEVRKDSYSRLAAWLVELRAQVESFNQTGSWQPPAKLESLALGQVIVYGHLSVFASAEILRGGLEQMIHNAEVFADRLPADYLRDQLNTFSDEAYSLLLKVREQAITIPDWDEPVPLRKQPDPAT